MDPFSVARWLVREWLRRLAEQEELRVGLCCPRASVPKPEGVAQAGSVCCVLGAPHRVNGKVSGHLRVGHTPVHFTDVDLHAYIVGNDGRAYTAISHIPPPAAQALLPLTPLGGLFGWLFALEKPGWENGFSLTGEAGGGPELLLGALFWEGGCACPRA